MNLILVARLAEYINPWRGLGVRRTVARGPTEPGYVPEDERTASYHHARIRYFAEELRQGQSVTPLEVDCRCSHGRVLALPVLLDGHHRLAGAILAGADRLPIEFGGRVDLLRYLEGKRKTAPWD